jgi:citrate lyase beta subunit
VGFSRELCIHRQQVPIVNECFQAAARGGVGALRRAELILSETRGDSIVTPHA